MLFFNVRRLVAIDLHAIGKCLFCSTDFNCQANLAHLQNIGEIAALIDCLCDKHLKDIFLFQHLSEGLLKHPQPVGGGAAI
jgi:hypothetical protein